jgi:hypothetical protein
MSAFDVDLHECSTGIGDVYEDQVMNLAWMVQLSTSTTASNHVIQWHVFTSV